MKCDRTFREGDRIILNGEGKRELKTLEILSLPVPEPGTGWTVTMGMLAISTAKYNT